MKHNGDETLHDVDETLHDKDEVDCNKDENWCITDGIPLENTTQIPRASIMQSASISKT